MSSVISYLSSLASSYGIDFDRDNLIFQAKDLEKFQSFAAELFIYKATNFAFSNAYKITTGQRDDVSWIALIAKPGTPRKDEEPAINTSIANDETAHVSFTEMMVGDEMKARKLDNPDRIHIFMEMTGNDEIKARDVIYHEMTPHTPAPDVVPFPSPAKKARDFFNEKRKINILNVRPNAGEEDLKNMLDRDWSDRKSLFDAWQLEDLRKLAKEDKKRFKAEKKEWKKYQKYLREQHAKKFGREPKERVSRRKSPARRWRNAPERRNIYYVVSVSLSKEVEVDLFRKEKHAKKFAEYLCRQDCVFSTVSVGSGEIRRKFSPLDV